MVGLSIVTQRHSAMAVYHDWQRRAHVDCDGARPTHCGVSGILISRRFFGVNISLR